MKNWFLETWPLVPPPRGLKREDHHVWNKKGDSAFSAVRQTAKSGIMRNMKLV
jgi:hypothetical protein